ncbi:hypothetical protein B0O79_1680 [Flavobacteriaceae bacterium MAR_2009_75]|nr:hypothetical protein B0O79_1680 [Flavobacteriaceae bacterium MAR_2009_75]
MTIKTNNTELKKIIYILILSVTYATAQDSTSVQLISRSLPDKVMLRWAVNSPSGWKMANETGFLVERSTISRNGTAVVPIERKMLTSSPLKPQPLEAWEMLAKQDQSTAILAQALYGESFETITPNPGVLGEVTAINEELEQRFTFALIAAEQNYEAALLAGWGLTDSSVVQGERYVYKVFVAPLNDSPSTIKEASTYAGTELFEDLPKPLQLSGIFKDAQALLSWDYGLLSHLYTNYIVERSTDGETFLQLNKQPIFSATQETSASIGISLYYTDSIPNNQLLYYRVKGKTAFGEVGPASEVVQGEGKKALEFVPRIYRKEIPTDQNVILYWEFKKEGNSLINKFQLNRGNTNEGPFETVIDDIPKDQRQISFNKLERINYFTISAVDKEGVKSESLPVMVQPVDSIPPATPTNLAGTIDTTGIVKLRWLNNKDIDLAGYRIFRSYNPKSEFTEVTSETWPFNEYLDTLQIKNLNQKIYYKIKAEDQRFNLSKFSQTLVLLKPDVTPPSSPVIGGYKITDEGIKIQWIKSSSGDVAAHQLYRKSMASQTEKSWELIYSGNDTLYLDNNLNGLNDIQYTIIAKDSTGFESLPSKPIVIKWKGNQIQNKDINFTGTADRELRFINLSWKAKSIELSEIRLFKGVDSEHLHLYKVFDAKMNSYNDTDLKINSNYVYGLQLVSSSGVLSKIQKVKVKY